MIMAKKIIIKQTKSVIGSKPIQRATMRALGLRRINSEREHEETGTIKGMIDVVKHLVTVEEKKR